MSTLYIVIERGGGLAVHKAASGDVSQRERGAPSSGSRTGTLYGVHYSEY